MATEVENPFVIVYVPVVCPLKFATGVNVISPFVFVTRVPFASPVTVNKVLLPPSASGLPVNTLNVKAALVQPSAIDFVISIPVITWVVGGGINVIFLESKLTLPQASVATQVIIQEVEVFTAVGLNVAVLPPGSMVNVPGVLALH